MYSTIYETKTYMVYPLFVQSYIIFIFSNINVEVVQHILSNQWNFNYLFKIIRQ